MNSQALFITAAISAVICVVLGAVYVRVRQHNEKWTILSLVASIIAGLAAAAQVALAAAPPSTAKPTNAGPASPAVSLQSSVPPSTAITKSPPPSAAEGITPPEDVLLACFPQDCRSYGHNLQVFGKLPADYVPAVIFVRGEDRKWYAQGQVDRASDGSWKASVGVGPATSKANRDLPHRICLFSGTQTLLADLQDEMAANTPLDSVPSGWQERGCTDAVRPQGT